MCDLSNVIHTAKLTRIGDAHIAKAKAYEAKVKAEVIQARRQGNDCKDKGIKNLSKAISGPRAKPLTCVQRDRDTSDGGKVGQMTADPREVDAVVKRAWKAIYDGMQGCITPAVAKFLSKYNDFIARHSEMVVQPLDALATYESFQRIKESAAALDGWHPTELSLMSLQACGYIAIMLNDIEGGAPWPRSSTHALIAYLEKERRKEPK